ncbi:hypothetical protein LT493_13480 [Streptomyces tricolor]|nr:hypothetical protein [Streptomyces tricolor]
MGAADTDGRRHGRGRRPVPRPGRRPHPVPGVFGLGLGYARSDSWGRRRVGINTFHGEDAERIVSQVLATAMV